MTTELRVLHGTGSPSGRYAVAWGIPGVSHLDQLANRDDRPDNKVRNFLFEKRTLQIVGTIPLHTRSTRNAFFGMYVYKDGGNDWHGWGNNGKNHSSVSTFWNLSEEWAVILHEGKWWFEAVYLCHRRDSHFVFTEIGDQVEDFVRAYLRRTRRTAYLHAHQLDERNPTVEVNAVIVAPPHLVFHVSAGIPKKENDPLALEAVLTLKIHTVGRGLAVSPTDFKVLR